MGEADVDLSAKAIEQNLTDDDGQSIRSNAERNVSNYENTSLFESRGNKFPA